MNEREIRGYAIIAKGDTPKRIEKNVFKIHSQSKDKDYIVSNNGGWHCTCPDHQFRNVECKHINAVKFYLKLKEKMKDDGVSDLKQSKEVKECVYCHSTEIIKYGKRKTKFGVKQTYKCKNCKRRFVINEIKSIGSDPKIITLVLDLYFKGLSQRKIVDHLKQFYHLSVHQTTVMRWIKRFTKLIEEYVKDLSPETSKRWHVDEMMVKT
ncbi:MAG: IS1/IS1595 family N-terminal zinc-binding domain-containing protein, partial [Candidatus Heimdallarchaeaceae archaeon]